MQSAHYLTRSSHGPPYANKTRSLSGHECCVGTTNDLRKRLVQHKRRLIPGFTKKYNLHRLVYFEQLADMETARRRERQLKGMSRAKKEATINGANPDRHELTEL